MGAVRGHTDSLNRRVAFDFKRAARMLAAIYKPWEFQKRLVDHTGAINLGLWMRTLVWYRHATRLPRPIVSGRCVARRFLDLHYEVMPSNAAQSLDSTRSSRPPSSLSHSSGGEHSTRRS
jgi:hypothetical protein